MLKCQLKNEGNNKISMISYKMGVILKKTYMTPKLMSECHFLLVGDFLNHGLVAYLCQAFLVTLNIVMFSIKTFKPIVVICTGN